MFQYLKTWATAIAAILWLIVLTPQTNAQTSTLSATYSVKKGLPSSTINHIVEDNNNGIWIATENGLKVINQPEKQWLEKRMSGKSIMQIGFLAPYAFVGCRDSLFIFNLTTKKQTQAYPKQTIGSILKIKQLQNTIWIVTQNAVYKWINNQLVSIPYNPKQGNIFDITNYNGTIVAVTYPQGKIETLAGSSFSVNEQLTKIANPISAPLLCITSKNDTLAIGGDGFYSVYANGKIIDKNNYPLRNDVKYNYAVWDIAFVDDMIYFGIGDTHNLVNGGIIKAFPLFSTLPTGSPYIQTLYYQKSKHTLWTGSLYDGVFLIQGINQSIVHNGFKYQPGLSVSNFYLYNGQNTFAIENGKRKPIAAKDTRLIATINDTTYILSYTNLTIIPKKGKIISSKTTPTEGRLYTHAQRLGDSLYAFALYKPTSIFNLKTLDQSSLGQNKIITAVEKQNNFIVSHNEGIGFTMYTSIGSHPVNFEKDNRTDIDDFTTNANNEVITLSENKVKYYSLQNNLSQLHLTSQFDFTKHFKDFAPKWIVNGAKNTIYAISEKGIVVMQDQTPVHFIEINDIKITNKPFIDPFNRLVIQHDNTTRLLPLKQIALKANQINSITAPEKIFEKDAIQINLIFKNEAIAPIQLQKIEIIEDNKKIYEHYSLQQTIIIDTLLPKGQYQLKVYSNNILLYNKRMSIKLPWQQNPLFRFSILLLVILALYLFFKNRYNQKMYAKKLINNKLELIQQNLNPHFIFNSLNLIYSSILEDKKEEALQTVRDFSSLHRNFLERSKEKKVSVASELRFIESYLAIESMRFKDNIAINHIITIDPNCDTNTIFIPPNILQPLIENAIKYGILGYQGTENPVIYIDVQGSKKQVTISIENAIGETIELYKGTGMGLSIVTERLTLFNQENEYNIKFYTNQSGIHFTKSYRVSIEINL